MRGTGKVAVSAPEAVASSVEQLVPAQEPVQEPAPEPDPFDTKPGPLAAFRKIPKRVRWWIYSLAATAFAIELVLDASDAGIVPEREQAIAFGIAGVFGLTMATANTDRA